MGRQFKEREKEQITFALSAEMFWAEKTLAVFNGQTLSERMRELVEHDVGKNYAILLKKEW